MAIGGFHDEGLLVAMRKAFEAPEQREFAALRWREHSHLEHAVRADAHAGGFAFALVTVDRGRNAAGLALAERCRERDGECVRELGRTLHALLRWQRDFAQVRQLPPATDMRRLFFHRVDRLVRRDSTFQLRNLFFEAPPPLAGQKIEVRFDPLDLTQVEIYFGGKPEGRARLVDAVVNGRTYR